MQIINDTPLSFAPLAWQLSPPEHVLCIIAKATFAVRHGQAAVLVPDQEPVLGDVFAGMSHVSSCVYPSDFVPHKPRADLLLVGHAHQKGGVAAARMDVRFRVGDRAAALRVSGDRYWIDTAAGTSTKPEPFAKMPLCYERAFGGPGYAPNPIGKGVFGDHAETLEQRPLPNIEDALGLAPAGFGALASTWGTRTAKLGTFDARWLAERWPWLPRDFDPAHYNAAPPALQVEHLRGDEEIACTGLHPQHHEYLTRLPGLRARAFVEDAAFREAPMLLDTLWLDLDRERLVLVWRGHVPVSSEEYKEVGAIALALEPLGAEVSVDQHRQRVTAWRAARQPAPPAAVELPPANDNDPAAEADGAALSARAETVALLTQANAPQPIIDRVRAGESPEAILESLIAGMSEEDKRRAEQARTDAQTEVARMVAAAGHDPAVLTAPRPKKAPRVAIAPWSRARVELCIAEGESMAEADLSDLDLSGLNLSQKDLAGALLAGADLSRADLSEAKLVGAVLAGAKLDGARLCRAELVGADLHGAAGEGVDLSEARLTGADLGAARLGGARFDGVSAQAATFLEADLTAACFDGADLSGARLSRCRLAGARLRKATLREASLEGANADGADFSESDLSRLRASEGTSLRGARMHRAGADGSLWMDAKLAEADLSLGSFVGSDFRGADLGHARLIGTNLKGSDLCYSDMRAARAQSSNLHGCRFEGADLTDADLESANLYEAELWRAELAGANLVGAHLAMTKLTSDRGAP